MGLLHILMLLFITHVSKLMIHAGLEVRPLAEEVEPCVICDDPLTHDDVVVCAAQGMARSSFIADQ